MSFGVEFFFFAVGRKITGGKTNMAKVELKQPIVDEIKGILDGAQAAVTVGYLGITVDQDTKLRKELRENGVIYKVFKNTLITRAVEGTEFDGIVPDLKGSTALAVSKTDATAPARIISKYAKDIESLNLKGGVVEGTYYDAEGMKKIAAVPGREELLSRLLGSLQSPIANFARVLNQVAEKGGEAAPQAE
jgi:large subunit ribosomal protein L10